MDGFKMKENELRPLPPKYTKEFLQIHLNKLREDFWKTALKGGIRDYSPNNLRRFDEELSENIMGAFAKEGCPDPSLATLWYVYAILGSYFGDVIVHNLGGVWSYPNRLVVILALLFGRPDWVYKRWYVRVGRQKVSVFIIAMKRQTLGRARAPLTTAYDKVVRASAREGPVTFRT